MKPVALVVGASSGLGRAIAQRLARDGYQTYAAARAYAESEKTPPAGCIPLALDVTEDASVEAALAHILQADGRVDVLVNCAAQLVLGACEETDMAELSRVLGTNVLGSIRVARAVLPAMRARGGGRIVQLSSLNGRFAVPFQGAYTASKHALEGWCETLAMEAAPFGIQVTLVEPGDCRSGSDAYRLHAGLAQDEQSPYHTRYKAAAAKIHHDETNGMQPEVVANAIARLLRRRRQPLRRVVARLDQRLALYLHTLLPGRWFARIITAYYAPAKTARRQQ